MRRALGVLVCAALLTACDQGGNESTLETTGTTPASPSTSTSEPSDPATSDGPDPEVVETIATGLEVPWGLDFFPDGDAIVTERDSKRVLRIGAEGDHEITELGTIEAAEPFNEAGLLGVALSPDFESDRTAYFYVSTATDNRVLRAQIDGDSLGTPEPILTGIPLGSNHDGGRLQFGPDGYLYVSTGETGAQPQLAQDRESLAGKILRITTDGEPAPGNPFDTEIWSWGHRNVQGLAFDDGERLWASEFGQDRVRRAEPHRGGRQLRVARGRGRRRRTRLRRPAGHLVDRRGLPLRFGVLRRLPVDGRVAGRAAVAGAGDRRPGARPRGLLRRRLRPDAHHRGRPRRAASG